MARNLDYQQEPLDRADDVAQALDALQSLIGSSDDLHTVDSADMASLLDILNRELATSLRDVRKAKPRLASVKGGCVMSELTANRVMFPEEHQR